MSIRQKIYVATPSGWSDTKTPAIGDRLLKITFKNGKKVVSREVYLTLNGEITIPKTTVYE